MPYIAAGALSKYPGLRAVTPTMHRFTLAFDDVELEREFRRIHSEHAHARHRIVWFLATAATMAMAAIDAIVVEPARLRTIWAIRYAGVLPFLSCVVLFGYVPAHVYRRWGQSVTVVGLFGGLVGIALIGVSLAPLPVATTHYGTMVAAMGLLIFHALGVARFGWTVVAGISGSLVVVAALRVGGAAWSQVAYGAFFIAIANVLGTLIGYTLEKLRRLELVQQHTIEEERAKSDRLLRNMLPASIAERLKRQPGAIADGFDAVTVLFADIAGFTPMSAQMAPAEVVGLLNDVFSAFDQMAQRRGLEKIKTIGDAYMLVGGLPTPRADHAEAVADMALEMRDAIVRVGAGRLGLRIGMHSGPVVAGVIGTSKYSYDLWGDTVNTASRMESHGAAGEIHVSDACRAALGDGFLIEPRGVVEIKGKGPMATYWLRGRRVAGGAAA